MAIGFWLFVFLTIALSGLALAVSNVGYRVLLLACLALGLTPLGFIEGPGIPVFLPELILIALSVGIVAHNYRALPRVRLSAFMLVFCGFFVLQLMFAGLQGTVTIVDLIRDARPIAFVALLLFLIDVLRQTSVSNQISEKEIVRAMFVFVICDVLFYLAAHAGLLSIGGITGEFYARTGLIRYADLMSISIFGVANYFVFSSKRQRVSLAWLFICGAIAILSVNRIFLLGFLIGICWWIGAAARHWTRIPLVPYIAGLSPIFLGVVAGVLYTRSQPEAGEIVSRVTELFDMSLLIAALQYRFVEPALVGGYELTPLTFLVGEGFGLKFYVPWFEYRGLDPWHFSVDSLFAFAFFKYGIVGLSILCFAISRIIWGAPWSVANLWIWLYLFVHSGVNVPGFLLFLIVLTILRNGSWILDWGVPRRLRDTAMVVA